MDHSEQEYITRCKKMIEEKFHFGNGHGELRQRDLEYLAENIEDKSGIRLSLSTLKRLWKKDYDKVPHPATLQALVSLLGYKDWQEFKLREAPATPVPEPSAKPIPKKPPSFKPWVALSILVLVAVLVWLIAFRSKPVARVVKKPVVKGEVIFAGNKTVSQGVPNTIIFNYDVSNVEADSFFFQQSWNELEKVKIDPKGKVYSAIYLYPGFHRAKLIANDSIIKRFRVHVTTDGWFPLAHYGSNDTDPIYLSKENMVSGGVLHVTRDMAKASGVNIEREFVTSYFNVRDFANTSSDNFSLETRIKNDNIKTIACPGFEITVLTEEHIFLLRMMGKGCERGIAVKMGETVHDGVNKDLSIFGRNLQEWQKIKIAIKNKNATIFLDDQSVYNLSFKKDFGKIVGLNCKFLGTGAIDYVRLQNASGQMVYADEFGDDPPAVIHP